MWLESFSFLDILIEGWAVGMDEDIPMSCYTKLQKCGHLYDIIRLMDRERGMDERRMGRIG